jgi:anthranilate synthase component II
MKILIIDNYDSFTYNLYQLVGELLDDYPDSEVDVIRNDKITLAQIQNAGYDRVIISPGPGAPGDPAYFGVCGEVIRKLGPTIPVLGVCLGMQGIASAFGAKVIRAARPMHGKTSKISHNSKGLFTGLPQQLEVMRYHSLIVDDTTVPDELEVTARTSDGTIMGLAHTSYHICGIQFHPESFASEGGKILLGNFIKGNIS